MKTLACAVLLLPLACNMGPEPEDDSAELAVDTAAITHSDPDRVIVWQQNITAYDTDANIANSLKQAFAHAIAPDIMIFEECPLAACLVGAAATIDADGRVTNPDAGSVAGWLKAHHLLSRYRFFNSMSRAIAWRNNSGGAEDTRFRKVKTLVWGSKTYPGSNTTDPDTGDNFVPCATTLGGVWRIPTVTLTDAREGKGPERDLIVTSVQWFVERECAVRMLTWFEQHWKTAPELRKRDGTNAGDYVDVFLLGGDWNATPDTYIVHAFRDGELKGGEWHHDLGAHAGITYNGFNGTSRDKKRADYLFGRAYHGHWVDWGTFAVDPDTFYPKNPLNDHGALRIGFDY